MLPCDGEQPAVDNPLLSLVPPTDALGPCPSAPLDCVNEPDYIPLRPDQRTGYEEFWATHCAFLGRLGYILRPRYQPGWKPSWPTNKEPKKYCEDAYALDVRPFQYCSPFSRLTQPCSLGSYVTPRVDKTGRM